MTHRRSRSRCRSCCIQALLGSRTRSVWPRRSSPSRQRWRRTSRSSKLEVVIDPAAICSLNVAVTSAPTATPDELGEGTRPVIVGGVVSDPASSTKTTSTGSSKTRTNRSDSCRRARMRRPHWLRRSRLEGVERGVVDTGGREGGADGVVAGRSCDRTRHKWCRRRSRPASRTWPPASRLRTRRRT